MTTFQNTKQVYINGDKKTAYSLFLNDSTYLEKTFEEFCSAMDNIISLNNSKSVNPNKKNG